MIVHRLLPGGERIGQAAPAERARLHLGVVEEAGVEIGDDPLPVHAGADEGELLAAVARLLTGGKRLRAAFLYWGYRGTGQPDSDAIVQVATAMEFFQAAALIHDDVMDDSDTRRGMPAAHRSLAARHEREEWAGGCGHPVSLPGPCVPRFTRRGRSR